MDSGVSVTLWPNGFVGILSALAPNYLAGAKIFRIQTSHRYNRELPDRHSEAIQVESVRI